MGKYARARQAKDDNTIRCMRLACWITKASNTHSEYVILIVLTRQKKIGYADAPQTYVCIYSACFVMNL